jgi:hypothetical protein
MKIFFVGRCFGLVLILAATALSSSKGVDQSAAVKDDLIKLEKQSWEAWKNGDSKFFDNFLSDDHVEVGFTGVSSKTMVVKGVASGVCHVKSYALDHFELRMLAADTALLTYHETQDTECAGQAVPSPCWISSLYMRRDGRWLNIFYQQTAETK